MVLFVVMHQCRHLIERLIFYCFFGQNFVHLQLNVANSLSDTLENVLMIMMHGWHTVRFISVTINVQWRSVHLYMFLCCYIVFWFSRRYLKVSYTVACVFIIIIIVYSKQFDSLESLPVYNIAAVI